jgi:transposase
MSRSIAKFGGLLPMMGQHTRSESLFYYFRLEDHVPENHLLRLIDRHVNIDFVHEKLRDSYSETGRPSIDPEVLLRILLIGYLYGVTSERKLVEELRMHLAWRWFTGLGFDEEVPHHSTFSKNRHGRFHESDLFRELFEEVVRRCMEVGLVDGNHLSIDGSFIEANASNVSRIPHEQLGEVAHVKRNVQDYLSDLEHQNPTEPEIQPQARISTTDPDSTYHSKGNRPAKLGYFDNYLIDNQSCVIVDVEATPARLSQESAAARKMITRSQQKHGSFPQSLAADAGYGNGELLAWLEERGITSYIPLREYHPAPKGPFYSIEQFRYHPSTNSYECPGGKELKYIGMKLRSRSYIYRATPKKCGECSQKVQCTSAQFKQLVVHMHDSVRQRARERTKHPLFRFAQRQRRKVEALFAELKNQIGLRRARLRMTKYVREQFLLAATAQNLKRFVKFMSLRSRQLSVVAN